MPWLHIAEIVADEAATRGFGNRHPRNTMVGGPNVASFAYVQRVMVRMKERGRDAVILGCTELTHSEDGVAVLPVLDSTRFLASAAVRRAVDWHRKEESGSPDAVTQQGCSLQRL